MMSHKMDPISGVQEFPKTVLCLRPDEYWDAWRKTSGEEPPDFEKLPSIPFLPDPLNWNGKCVRQAADWPEVRGAILKAFRHWVLGAYPEPPGNVEGKIVSQRHEPSGAVTREVELAFGPGHRAKLHLELAVPPGAGPFPVFMTMRTHAGWARIALARGYAAVAVSCCDGADDTQAYKEIWPPCDWSMLCRRAWGAGRALDWLATRPFIDREKVCITGHSRNGKLSVIAGAIDERFSVVVSSSSGLAGAAPYRLAGDAHFCQGIEMTSSAYPEWFHPRLRFFSGREHRLPVDANLFLALIAPRAVLVGAGLNDHADSPKAVELAVASAGTIWSLLGDRERKGLRIVWRTGEHDLHAEDVEKYIDWCDLQFGRPAGESDRRLETEFPETRYFPYRYAEWKKLNGEGHNPGALPAPQGLSKGLAEDVASWEAGRADRERRIRFLLGEAPPSATRPAGTYGTDRDYTFPLLLRPPLDGDIAMERHDFSFGEYVAASLYALPGAKKRAEESGEKMPAALWLHGESIACGYSAPATRTPKMPGPLVKAGFAVWTYDQIGNGSRLLEGARFYERYPRWSYLGKQVQDALRAWEAVRELSWIDPERIFLVGFGDGATAAIVAGALDPRIAGVAIASGFTPFRTDTPDKPTGGLARYALWDGGGLIPRLGVFAGSAAAAGHVPIDFDELLAALAPRPLVVVTPVLDQQANHTDVLKALETVKSIYTLYRAQENLRHAAPLDHRRFSQGIQEVLYAALRRAAGLEGRAS